MKISKKIKVGGRDYTVVIADRFKGKNKKFCGFAEHSICKISLVRKDVHSEKKYSKDYKNETIFHEILHCIDAVYLGQVLSENRIEMLSKGIAQVLKDNFNFYLEF